MDLRRFFVHISMVKRGKVLSYEFYSISDIMAELSNLSNTVDHAQSTNSARLVHE